MSLGCEGPTKSDPHNQKINEETVLIRYCALMPTLFPTLTIPKLDLWEEPLALNVICAFKMKALKDSLYENCKKSAGTISGEYRGRAHVTSQADTQKVKYELSWKFYHTSWAFIPTKNKLTIGFSEPVSLWWKHHMMKFHNFEHSSYGTCITQILIIKNHYTIKHP